MHFNFLRSLLAALAGLCLAAAASAADATDPDADASANSTKAATTEQVVVPEIDRREVHVPRYPSNDFELGAFTGVYAMQNFGSSPVVGLRLGYHITEDYFVEGVWGQAQVSDAAFRQILPGGVFTSENEKLSYYNLSAGYNVLPGEMFTGSKLAWPFSLYVIGGIGNTTVAQQDRQTFNFGTGLRLYFNDHIALQMDARDHVFSLDLLGQRKTTHNLELTLGLTGSF